MERQSAQVRWSLTLTRGFHEEAFEHKQVAASAVRVFPLLPPPLPSARCTSGGAHGVGRAGATFVAAEAGARSTSAWTVDGDAERPQLHWEANPLSALDSRGQEMEEVDALASEQLAVTACFPPANFPRSDEYEANARAR